MLITGSWPLIVIECIRPEQPDSLHDIWNVWSTTIVASKRTSGSSYRKLLQLFHYYSSGHLSFLSWLDAMRMRTPNSDKRGWFHRNSSECILKIVYRNLSSRIRRNNFLIKFARLRNEDLEGQSQYSSSQLESTHPTRQVFTPLSFGYLAGDPD